MFAAMFDQDACVRLLLAAGASPNRRTHTGQSAADLARAASAAKSLTLLESARAHAA
jgi:ankyrin repeat protein